MKEKESIALIASIVLVLMTAIVIVLPAQDCREDDCTDELTLYDLIGKRVAAESLVYNLRVTGRLSHSFERWSVRDGRGLGVSFFFYDVESIEETDSDAGAKFLIRLGLLGAR